MATRYWVGGAGNWSSTTKWSATSGGASGASVPTSADDAVFDANSGGKFTATVDTAQSVNSITITPSAAVGVQQIALSARLRTNNLTTTGTAGNNRIWFRGNTYGIAQDFIVNGTVSISDCDFRDIYVIGTAAPISGTRIGDLRGIRGITASTPKTVYWSSAAGGTWSATNWAATSGGATSNDNFPLAQDTAVIENTGLNTSATVTLNATLPFIGTLDMSTRTNAATISISAGNVLYGNLVTGSGITYSGAQVVTFSGRNTQTITSAGKTFSGGITVDSYGGTVELADALNIGTNNLTVTNGTFDTKNFNVTAGALASSNSNVRTINLGSSTLSFSTNGNTFDFITNTNLTFNAGTSQINITAGGSLNGGSSIFYNVAFTSSASVSISGSNTINNLTISAPAATGIRTFILLADQTINGTLTVAGATAVRRIFVRSNTLGTPRTLTVNSLSAQDCDFRDITIAGAAAGSSPTRAGDCGGNTGITFPAAKTVYWNLAGTQNWSATGWAPSSGGTPDINQFPLAQDTAVVNDAGSVGPDLTINAAWNIGTFDSSLRTASVNINTSTSTPFFYGDWKFGSGVTSTNAAGAITFAGRGTQTITSAGKEFGCPVTIDCVTGVVQLADAMSVRSTRTLTLASGTFDAVTYNVTTGVFSSSNTNARTLKMGSGAWTLSGTGSVWSIGGVTGLNFYKGTANIVLSDTTTAARIFNGGNLSYNKLTIGGATGTSTLTFGQNNQFTELASTKTVAHTIALGTTTQTFGAWTVTGTAGNVVTVTGTGALIIAGAAVSGVNYLALGATRVSLLSPGEFYAGANSTATDAAAPLYLTAKPADSTRYWVGGTGNWSDTARWSTSSGGSGGASVPRSHDDVVFDSLSSATAYTATVDVVTGGIRMKALTIAGPASGNLTLAGGTVIVGIHGDVTLPATGLTRTYTGQITLSGSSTGRTFTTNGTSLDSATTVNGVGCEWTLGSAAVFGSSATLLVTNGTFDTGNYDFTALAITSSNSNSRTINLGTSTLTLSSSGTAIDFANPINLLFYPGNSTIDLSGTGPSFSGGGLTFNNVNFNSTNPSPISVVGANTFNNLSFAGFISAGSRSIFVSDNQTITDTLSFLAGTNATMRQFVQSNTIGTTRTLTCANFVGTDVDFRDITIAGAAAPVSGTRLGDCKGNSGITFDAAKTVYFTSISGGNWGDNSWTFVAGNAADPTAFPLAQDTAIFPISPLVRPASGLTVTINANYNIGTIDMSARTSNTMTLATSSNTPTIYGNWINGTGTTLTGTGILTFAGRGSQTVTSSGKTFTQRFIINSPSGSVTLQDAFVCDNASSNCITITQGTFDAATFNVTLSAAGSSFNASGSGIRTVAVGSGTWSFASASTAWDASTSTNLTVTGTGTISLTSPSAKTFSGGGVNYSGITLNQGGAGALTITGNNTFANISNTYKATGATTIAMGTTTQTVGSFTASGEDGRVLTVQGTSASSPATLIFTGAGQATTPTTDYLAITGVRAYSLDTTWYAGANSTNNGSLGWYFEAGGGGPISVFIIESATSADAQSNTANITVSMSETTTASDAAAAGLIYIGTLNESATAADVAEAFRAFLADVSESAIPLDTPQGANTGSSSLSESAAVSETQAAQFTAVTAVSESSTAQESGASLAVLSGPIVEAASPADTTSVAPSTFGVIALAAAQAAESFNPAGSVYNASATVSVVAVDALRRSKLRVVDIEAFVSTGANVTGNTASGTVESGQITATVLP